MNADFRTWIIVILAVMLCLIGIGIDLWLCSKPKSKRKSKIAGTVVINTTDPEKDVMRFELEMSVAEMIEKDEITFKVVREVGS